MRHEIRHTRTSEEDMDALPDAALDFMGFALGDLAEHPTRDSRRADVPPYPSDGMVREFRVDVDGVTHALAVLFRYQVDEVALVILNLGHRVGA